nr:hypothetical protein [uncultured Flavobacterium sp.]
MRKLYASFYAALPIQKVTTDDKLYILNDDEIAVIKRKERISIALAAFFGAMGVVLLIIPEHFFSWLFPSTTLHLFGRTFVLPLAFWIYSVILVYIELMLLTFLNIWCAHEIAVATGFLNYENKHTQDKQNIMLDIGLEKKNKQILTYGIDPLQQSNRKAIFFWNLMFMLKATLSNFVFKLLIERVSGRYAARVLKNTVGIPIFAFWNAFGTYTILRKAKIIIMGQNLIESIVLAIYKIQPPSEDFNALLYDTLQYIAISKRDFHDNHYILAKNLLTVYNISPKDKHLLSDDFVQRLSATPEKQRKILMLLIIVGFLLDGKISIREKKKIREMNRLGILNENEDTICSWANDFIYGKGIDELLQKYIEPQTILQKK